MLPDKFKEDRFERSSAPSKNNQCLVSHCRPSVQIMYMSIQKPLLQAVHVQCIHYPYSRRVGGLMVSEPDSDLVVLV